MVLTESQHKLKKGDLAPNFFLKGTDGATHSLEHLKDKSAFLIVFMCNHCPYVLAKLDELNRIAADFKEKEVIVIGINSNESENYPEDSFENMKMFVGEGRIKFLYVHDETQEVAKLYGATCTPDSFLFDRNLKLIFHSRIDDPAGLEEVKRHEMYDAIKEYFGKGSISIQESASVGCSIKWK